MAKNKRNSQSTDGDFVSDVSDETVKILTENPTTTEAALAIEKPKEQVIDKRLGRLLKLLKR